MPKKTRQQKIRADQNREQADQFTFTYTQTPLQSSKMSHTLEDFSLIKSDIYKTIIWAAVFILLEFGIFISSKHFGW